MLSTLAIVPYNYLGRDMRFKERGLLDMYSVWASISVQIAMAAAGFGVWTLLFGVATRAGVRLWLAFRYSGYRPSLGFDWKIIRGDLGFSAQLTLNWFLFVLKERCIPIIIGRTQTVTQLGLLGFAGSLAAIPNLKVVQLLREVLLPLLARRHDRPGEQLRGLGTALRGHGPLRGPPVPLRLLLRRRRAPARPSGQMGPHVPALRGPLPGAALERPVQHRRPSTTPPRAARRAPPGST